MKYMGSKSRIKKYILPILQNLIDSYDIQTYIEPFCGGCNIIDDIKCKNRIANDISKPLIELWKGLQDNKQISLFSKQQYNNIKNNQDNFDGFTIGCAGFLHSYNGKYWGGYAGEIITKTGIKRDYRIESISNIIKQSEKLKDVKFTNLNYKECANNISNALIYCDIPYKNTTGYNNTFNHDEFWKWCREKSKNNFILISELEAPNDFKCIWSGNVTRTQDNKSRSVSVEKLFIYQGD